MGLSTLLNGVDRAAEDVIAGLKERIDRYERRAERIRNGALPEAMCYQRDDRELDGKLLKILSAK